MDDPFCAFCERPRRELRKLITGPGIFICDACVTLCRGVIDKERAALSAGTDVKTKRDLSCSFCGKTHGEVETLIAGRMVYICNECVGLCEDILYDETEELGSRG